MVDAIRKVGAQEGRIFADLTSELGRVRRVQPGERDPDRAEGVDLLLVRLGGIGLAQVGGERLAAVPLHVIDPAAPADRRPGKSTFGELLIQRIEHFLARAMLMGGMARSRFSAVVVQASGT